MKNKNMAWIKFKKNKLALFGSLILIILIIFSLLASFITKVDINKVDLSNISSPPSGEHILGTDEMGRDIFSRLIYGGRVSLLVGVMATFIQVTIGVTLGAIAGYFGGAVDFIIMRIVDIFMCFPFFVIAITLAALLGPSVWNVILIIGVLSWTSIARIVRAEILSIREMEYIEASKAIGLNWNEIIIRHIIPNVIPSILVTATLAIAGGILTESALSFLGLGVKLPKPSWGNMLSSAQKMSTLKNQWWQWVPPGLSVLLTVLSINFIGDGLRDALDPKIKV
ncbi:oligopeptide ABC transporter permease [Clostridium fallax]|uniref:Peptide/nickel transport system permease protein n=1 Tax=Clostridium fallax TaxID=1533 RepID=A0A1M4Y850_9CLOT|nr:oligopeptide ABC transporter permease [Clostridium fallax]SHF01850.1 peptide/nickel transport system permease protein [Clostridium fallax]SQB06015.1 ABC transporter permease [Clostridium fallax]